MPVAATDAARAPTGRARLAGLYAVTPDEADTARLAALVEAAIAGGARAIQYRNKAATPALQHEQARSADPPFSNFGLTWSTFDVGDAELASLYLPRDITSAVKKLRKVRVAHESLYAQRKLERPAEIRVPRLSA